MKKLGLLVLAILTLSIVQTQAQDVEKIINQSEQTMRGKSNYAVMKMTIVRPGWQREMIFKSWSKGLDKALILITSPARDEGSSFLKRDNELWNWQPKINKVIKMPSSMLSQSWMGSDFTNDDLVKETSLLDDYEHELMGSESVNGVECYKIKLIAKQDAAVVWGSIITWISKNDFLQMKVEFYDEDEYLVNTLTASEVKTMGGRKIPSRLEIIPADEEENRTIVEYEYIEFDQGIEDSFFSIQSMKRIN